MTRILHLADLHIGAPLSGLINYPGAPVIDPIETPYEAFDSAMEQALGGGYDAVIVAGDVFERPPDAERALLRFQRALDDFAEAGLPIVLISGNHDAESSLPGRLRMPAGARWLSAEHPETVVWDDLGIAVHGQSVGDRDEARDLAAGLPAPLAGLRNLGVLHTSLTGELSRRACAPTTLEVLDRAEYDYWALGHVHTPLVLPTATLAAFSGGTHARRPAEHGGRGLAVLTIDNSGVSVEWVVTAAVRYEPLDGANEEELALALSRELPGDATVVWTLNERSAHHLDVAREIAGVNPRYLVAAP